jgi:phytoene synthase
MEEGWGVLLSDSPLTREDLALYASRRGARLFELSARILGGEGAGGEPWALVDLARHSGNAEDAEAAVAASRAYPPLEMPAPLRPLGMLDALARRDSDPARRRWEPQGSPGRMWRMLRHWFSGR